jgi:aldose sugar dehydrogenase
MNFSMGARVVYALCASFAIFLVIGITDHYFSAHFAYGEVSQPQSALGPTLSDHTLRAEVVFRGINFPTSLAFLGINDILVLEKNEGTVRRIVNGNMLEDPLLKVNVSTQGERGMLGIAAATNNCEISKPFIFLYFTEANPNKDPVNPNLKESPVRNKLYRYELEDDKLVNPKLILDLPRSNWSIHNGGKVSIGPDCNVYLTVGDLYGENPQGSQLLSGKAGILRVNQEGLAVKTNGNDYVLGSSHPLNKYYAYGIRNSFGMDFDPVTGYLWDTENGPGFGDEINLVGPGFNSGWSEIQGFWKVTDQNMTVSHIDDLSDFSGKTYYSYPELATFRSVGLTGLSFLETTRYGLHYENDLVVGDFHNGNLYHFELKRDRTELDLIGELRDRIADNTTGLNRNILGRGFGGITDIEVSPDGYLYILSLYKGGDDCPGTSSEEKNCISYDSELQGTIFRVVSE